MRRWPDLPVYVHERGARHLADPARLVASAARLYGGEEGSRASGARSCRCRRTTCTSCGRETVLGDYAVEYTPGHASHHVCYLHRPTGTAFVGDMAGVRIPPSEYVIAPTPRRTSTSRRGIGRST